MRNLVIMLLLPFIFGCFTINVGRGGGKVMVMEKEFEGKSENKILLIDINGILSMDNKKDLFSFPTNSVETLKLFLEKAEQDNNIKAVILKINSPGGTITASDIMLNELLKYKESKKVKIISNFFDVAASGGYYIAMASDYIIAHPTTITGSIGVINMNVGLTKLLEKIGVENRTFKSVENKDIASPFRDMTNEEKVILQALIQDMHEKFVDVVATGRKSVLTKEEVLKIADGRPYTANQALMNKLVDQVGYITDAISRAKTEIKDNDAKIIGYYIAGYPINNYYTDPSALSNPVSINTSLFPADKDFSILKNKLEMLYLQ